MKRLIMNFVVGLFLIAGLLFGGCLSTTPAVPEVVKPQYIQEIEKAINHKSSATVDIVRYENDGFTLWLWIDSNLLPLDCDFVMVLGIENQELMLYNVIQVFVSENVRDGDPCDYADGAYIMYRDLMDKEDDRIKKEAQTKGGI